MMPTLMDLPPGCAFHPRCTLSVPRCNTDTPDLYETGSDDHLAACFVTTEKDN
jgi:oligopeptide/dipeptide ABC transporter ATP-binding protein